MQIKTSFRFHLTTVRMVNIKKGVGTTCFREGERKGNLYSIWKEYKLLDAMETSMEVSYNMRNRITLCSAIPGHICLWVDIKQKFSNIHVSCFIIHNRCLSLNIWINKIWYKGTVKIYLDIKENNTMTFARQQMELEIMILNKNNLDSERQIPCFLSYVDPKF